MYIIYILLYNNFIIYITIYYILDIRYYVYIYIYIYIYIIIYYMLFIIYHTCILYPGPSIGTSNLRPIHIRAQFGATSAHFNLIEFLLFECFLKLEHFLLPVGRMGSISPLVSRSAPSVCFLCTHT